MKICPVLKAGTMLKAQLLESSGLQRRTFLFESPECMGVICAWETCPAYPKVITKTVVAKPVKKRRRPPKVKA